MDDTPGYFFSFGTKSGRTVLNPKRAACYFFNWPLEKGIVSHNPAAGAKRWQLPKISAKEISFLSPGKYGAIRAPLSATIPKRPRMS